MLASSLSSIASSSSELLSISGSTTDKTQTAEFTTTENTMSQATTKTGIIHEANFVDGFAACNDTKYETLGRSVVFVHKNSKTHDAGDVDFAVRLKEPVRFQELFQGTAFMVDLNVRNRLLPAGAKIFFEITSEDGTQVRSARKGKPYSKLQQKAQFYNLLLNNSIELKDVSSPADFRFEPDDIVVFAYNGVDHVCIEQEVRALNLTYPFIPCWINRYDVARWKPVMELEKEKEERERERREAESRRIELEREKEELEKERRELETLRAELEREKEEEREKERRELETLRAEVERLRRTPK